jgi:hypothetical protein
MRDLSGNEESLHKLALAARDQAREALEPLAFGDFGVGVAPVAEQAHLIETDFALSDAERDAGSMRAATCDDESSAWLLLLAVEAFDQLFLQTVCFCWVGSIHHSLREFGKLSAGQGTPLVEFLRMTHNLRQLRWRQAVDLIDKLGGSHGRRIRVLVLPVNNGIVFQINLVADRITPKGEPVEEPMASCIKLDAVGASFTLSFQLPQSSGLVHSFDIFIAFLFKSDPTRSASF